MKRISILIIFLAGLTASSVIGQGFEKIYENHAKLSVSEIIEGEEAEFYLSQSGNYIVINTAEKYRIVSGLSGDEIVSGEHMDKSGSLGIASALLGQGAGGAMVDGEALKESSGFYAFDEQQVVVFLDWTMDENHIIAYDTRSGEKLWETEDYRFTPGSNKQVTSILASIAVSSAVSNAMPASAMAASGTYVSVDMNYFKGAHGSDNARAFITPLEGTGSFLLKAGDTHYCIDIRTGEERWKYDDYDVNIAEHHMMPEENLVALVNFNPAYFAKSDNYIFFFFIETGEEKYRIEHLNNYVKNRTYIQGDRLILDYYGLEIFDIKKEKRIVLSIDEKVVKASNTVSSLFGSDGGQKNSTAKAMPSVLGNGVVYAATSKMGRKTYPVSAASRNIKLHAYDISTGEILWSTKELDNGSYPVDLVSGQIILKRQKGLNKHIFYGVGAESGKITGSTDKIKQYMLRNDAGYVKLQNSILFSGKRGLYLYNLDNWKVMDEIDVKDADIGKLQTIDFKGNNLFMVGDKGIAFYDDNGNFLKKIKIRKVEGATWSDDLVVAFTKNNVEAIDLRNKTKSGTLNKVEMMVFSNNLKHWLLEENDLVKKYTLVKM